MESKGLQEATVETTGRSVGGMADRGTKFSNPGTSAAGPEGRGARANISEGSTEGLEGWAT